MTYLGADLIAALSSLQMYNFPHDQCCVLIKLKYNTVVFYIYIYIYRIERGARVYLR